VSGDRREAGKEHFETDAVYPGAAPKEDTTGSITITNGKTQMDFAGYVFAINGARWKIASSIFWTPGSR